MGVGLQHQRSVGRRRFTARVITVVALLSAGAAACAGAPAHRVASTATTSATSSSVAVVESTTSMTMPAATSTTAAAPATTGPVTTAGHAATPVPAGGGPVVPLDAEGPYSVAKVVDGDTVKVVIAGRTTTLRLIGIDTPETKDPRHPVECYGRDASAQAAKLLTGHVVRITYDSSQGRLDRYGRTLAYLWEADGQSFQWQMLEGGFAGEYTYAAPYRYQREFRAEAASARTAGRGLWSATTCNGDLDKP